MGKFYVWSTDSIKRADAMGITLNGRNARLCGAHNDFATVVTIDTNIEVSFDWSWKSVERILDNGGKFMS